MLRSRHTGESSYPEYAENTGFRFSPECRNEGQMQ